MTNQPQVHQRESLESRLLRTKFEFAESLDLVEELAGQILHLHERGTIHGDVRATTIWLERGQRVTLASAGSSLPSAKPADRLQSRPPEMAEAGDLSLPIAIADAQRELVKRGVEMDPRRVDIYQLGALACRLLTGEDVRAYQRSPLVKGAAGPASELIDQALGFDSSKRFSDVAHVIAAIQRCRGSSSADLDTSPSVPPKSELDTSIEKQRSELGPSEAELLQQLGNYQILGRLGQGGMGDVYRARDLSLDREVAIKVLPNELAREEEFVDRFRAEATAAARLTHPNIVQIYAIDEDKGRHFFVMQYVRGKSLAELLRERKRLSVDETLAIAEHVLAGLGAAHKQGFIHRDIKPANILLDRDDHRALLADFGLVKSLSMNSRTATGVIMGTVDYISPEQGRGSNVDERSDLYSVGVLLFHLLSGQLPFAADSPTAMIFQHAYETPPSLLDVAPNVPKHLARLIGKLLEKEPANRYPTALAVLQDLRKLRHESGKPPTGSFTQIIAAPNFDSFAIPESADEGQTALWERVRERLLGLFQRHAPAVLERLLNTQQQVDGAVAEYAGRCHELESLVGQAEEVLEELSSQSEAYREAAARLEHQLKHDAVQQDTDAAESEIRRFQDAAVDLDRQATEQRDQLEAMQLRLSKSKAVLLKLESQRDLLNARLQTAEASKQIESQSGQRRNLRKLALIVLIICVGAGGVFAIVQIERTLGRSHQTISSTKANSKNKGAVQQLRDIDLNDAIKGEVRSIDFAQRQRENYLHFATGGVDGAIYICTMSSVAADQGSVTRLAGHLKQVNRVLFSPDGERVASASDDGTIQLWNIARRDVIRVFKGHGTKVTDLAFSRDGSQLLSCSRDGTVRQWDVQLEKEIKSFRLGALRTSAISIAWSSDATRFLIGSSVHGAPSFSLWSIDRAKEILSIQDNETPSRDVSFLGGTNQAAFVSWDSIHVRDLNKGGEVRKFGKDVRCAAYTADGLRAVSGNKDGGVTVWDIPTGKELKRMAATHSGAVQTIAMTSDGNHAVSAAADGIRRWSLPAHVPPRQLNVFRTDSPVQSVRCSLDGSSAISADGEGVHVWNLEFPSRHYTPIREVGYACSAAAFSPDGGRIVFANGNPNGESRIFLRQAGSSVLSRSLREFPGHIGEITHLQFTRDGRHIISAGRDGRVCIWETQSDKELYALDLGSPVNSIAVHQSQLLVGDQAGRLRLWSLDSRKELHSFQESHRGAVLGVAISRDGSHAVSGGADRQLIAWDLATGKPQSKFVGHTAAVNSVALLPDGARLLSASDDGSVRLWNIGSGEQLALFQGHVGAVTSVAALADGKRAMSGGDDGTVRVWDLTQDNE